ncbi:MAG: FAD-dependent oxidoreductase [Alphaproteobacteria bacterium]|nr:FAD-dependent oxidoreductase [Alphaproteobacteria bacterium]
MPHIVILGTGFAGLWSAVAAARALDEARLSRADVRITVVNRDAWHAVRVRNYEPDLRQVRVALDDVLAPIGVERVEGEVTGVDFEHRQVVCRIRGTRHVLEYDRLVYALGSQLLRPDIPGLARYAFDVDTFEGGARLNAHIAGLPEQPPAPGRYTALIVGAGLTGIETATEMPGKLRASLGRVAPAEARAQVILADHRPVIGSDMGEDARRVIEKALACLGVVTRTGVSISAIDGGGATLSTGERIAAATIVWCTGMRANPLSQLFPGKRDRFGRIPVDRFMRVKGMPEIFAAGDAACAVIDDLHDSVMSCQHARPMGRFAGHNVVCDLLGKPMLPLRIDWYCTVLDLGPWGAVYTEGWERHVVATGAAAKRTKQIINCERIYPPRSRDLRQILDAAAPVVQAPPPAFG